MAKKKKTSTSASASTTAAAETARDAAREARRRRDEPARAAARAFAIDIAKQMADEKCEDVILLDVHGISTICDYFIIGTGTSERQMRAVIEHVEELGRSRGEKPFHRNGADSAAWIVLDYVDIVVHLFDAEHRRYYELETLWGDAPRIDF